MEKYTEWKKEIEKIISQVEGKVCVNFYDLNKNTGFSINGDKKVLSASMIKLLILAELMKKISEDKFSLSDTIMMANFMKTGGDGVLKELNSGHHFTLKELATLMIIVSDNQATNILIESAIIIVSERENLFSEIFFINSANIRSFIILADKTFLSPFIEKTLFLFKS